MQDGDGTRTHDVFWAEIAPCEHLVQLYEDDDVLLSSLEGFAAAGLAVGDAVVVIATPEHLRALRERLTASDIDVIAAENQDRYIALTAREALSEFMLGAWPDETLFRSFIARTLRRARSGGRRVRAFGEMVAVLWAEGHNGATVRLEHLWEQLRQEEAFSVFCAYPRTGFTRDASESLDEVRATHSRVVDALQPA